MRILSSVERGEVDFRDSVQKDLAVLQFGLEGLVEYKAQVLQFK